jgi:uracil-DNA glycosylase
VKGKRARIHALQQIRNPSCVRCDLCESTTNVCIMGRGEGTEIVLIGEAPGEAEARTGKPFMGAAGQLLNKLLDELHMTNRCYITNICRCRPADNRKPTPKEAKTCANLYLFRELNVINPWVIVCMGRTPCDLFFPNGFTRGELYETKAVFIIPTWHPAYCLPGRSPSATPQLKKALLDAKRLALRCQINKVPRMVELLESKGA